MKSALKINYPDFEIDSVIDEELKQDLDKITYDKITTSSTTRTIKNIRKNLSAALKSKYNIEDNEKLNDITSKILKIHGLHEDNFDIIKNFEDGLMERINDVSIDDNSNKNEKVMRGYLNEMEKPFDKLIGYDMLYRTLKDLYGEKEAKHLTGEMYDYSLGLSDSSNILVPYCWALDATKIVTQGRDFGMLPSGPCKHVSSYISCLCETIHQMSHHLAGAIAIGSLFLDLAHILIYKERRTINELRTDKKLRKSLENEIQQFIHSVNHLSRSAAESPFTNVSIFDSVKLSNLINEDNYAWYFPNMKAVSTDNDLDDKMSDDEFKQYILDYIIELQNLYMDFFEKGDPKNNGLMYRFPVTTINLSKDDDDQIQDEKFLKSICKRDISRFNIFISKGTKVASCCRLINNAEMMDFASQVNSLGGGGTISMGSHRVLTINFARIALESDSIEEYYEILNERTEAAAKILKAHKLLIMKLTEKGYEPFVANGFIQMKRMFSTFGVLGIVEAERILKDKFPEYFNKDTDIMKDILVKFDQLIREFSSKYKITGNAEQIPGESFAVRLANVDKIIFDLDDYFQMYANQFIPLWEESSLFERIVSFGKFDSCLSGGGVVHLNVSGNTTPSQNMELIKFTCKSKCEHFAITKCWTKCLDCGNVYSDKYDKCECGSTHLDYYLRVVGFFVPVSSWNKTRREWEFPRRKFTKIDMK